MVGLTPNSLGLRLNAALCAKNGDASVKDAERALDLNSEVNVARGVNDVDAMIFPMAGGSCGSDGDTSLLLLLHPVHSGGTLMGLTDLIGDAGVVKNTLGGGSLTCVDMGHYADISGFFK